MQPNYAPVLTIPEAARYLRVGPKAIRRLVRLNRIPHQKMDRRGTVRIHRSALERFLLAEKGVRP